MKAQVPPRTSSTGSIQSVEPGRDRWAFKITEVVARAFNGISLFCMLFAIVLMIDDLATGMIAFASSVFLWMFSSILIVLISIANAVNARD